MGLIRLFTLTKKNVITELSNIIINVKMILANTFLLIFLRIWSLKFLHHKDFFTLRKASRYYSLHYIFLKTIKLF